MFGILMKIRQIVSILLGLKQIIHGFSKPVKHFEMVLGEDKEVLEEAIDIVLDDNEIRVVCEKEKNVLAFLCTQYKEIEDLNKEKDALLTEMGNVGKQLQIYRDDLVGISKAIKNTSKFVKNTNKYLGGK